MVPPPEILYPLQIFGSLLLASLMGGATFVWYFRMRNVGGIAGNYFTMFFACISMYAVSLMFQITANTVEDATFWGGLALLHGITGWFCLFLAGEYSVTDSPRPIRVMTVGTCYGISLGGFLYTLLNPPGSGLVYVVDVPNYGWVSHVTLLFLLVNILSGFLSNACFLQFVIKGYRVAPNTSFGRRSRTLLIVLSIGLWIDVTLVGAGWIFEDFAIIGPIIIMFVSSIFIIFAFFLLFREYRIIYFMPHKAIGIIVMNTDGLVYFDHKFQKEVGSNAIREFLGPALTAVNNLVQETLELAAIEWVREFRTDKMTFLLDVRPQYDMIGLLLVSKPTQILLTAFRKFMDNLMVLYETTKGELCDTPEKEKRIHEICVKAFPFIPPID